MRLNLPGLTVLGAFGAAALLFTTGCHSANDVSINALRANPAPELETVAMTAEQRKNHNAYVVNSNWRQIHDDWDMIWLLGDAGTLTSYPVPR